MPLTRRPDDADEPPLSAELRAVLLHGTWPAGKTLRDYPHDLLRELWRVHGPALLASPDCPEEPWFLARDEFVTFIRSELL